MPDRDVPTTSATTSAPASAPFLRVQPPTARLARGGLPWLLALGLVLLGLALVGGEHGLLQYLRLSQQRDAMAATRDTLQARNDALEARIEALKTDPFALEKLARERYNMRAADEQVIVIRPADPAGDPGAVPRSKQP